MKLKYSIILSYCLTQGEKKYKGVQTGGNRLYRVYILISSPLELCNDNVIFTFYDSGKL